MQIYSKLTFFYKNTFAKPQQSYNHKSWTRFRIFWAQESDFKLMHLSDIVPRPGRFQIGVWNDAWFWCFCFLCGCPMPFQCV